MVIIYNFMSLHVNSLFEITVNLMLCATKVNKRWGKKQERQKKSHRKKCIVSQKWPLVLIVL